MNNLNIESNNDKIRRSNAYLSAIKNNTLAATQNEIKQQTDEVLMNDFMRYGGNTNPYGLRRFGEAGATGDDGSTQTPAPTYEDDGYYYYDNRKFKLDSDKPVNPFFKRPYYSLSDENGRQIRITPEIYDLLNSGDPMNTAIPISDVTWGGYEVLGRNPSWWAQDDNWKKEGWNAKPIVKGRSLDQFYKENPDYYADIAVGGTISQRMPDGRIEYYEILDRDAEGSASNKSSDGKFDIESNVTPTYPMDYLGVRVGNSGNIEAQDQETLDYENRDSSWFNLGANGEAILPYVEFNKNPGFQYFAPDTIPTVTITPRKLKSEVLAEQQAEEEQKEKMEADRLAAIARTRARVVAIRQEQERQEKERRKKINNTNSTQSVTQNNAYKKTNPTGALGGRRINKIKAYGGESNTDKIIDEPKNFRPAEPQMPEGKGLSSLLDGMNYYNSKEEYTDMGPKFKIRGFGEDYMTPDEYYKRMNFNDKQMDYVTNKLGLPTPTNYVYDENRETLDPESMRIHMKKTKTGNPYIIASSIMDIAGNLGQRLAYAKRKKEYDDQMTHINDSDRIFSTASRIIGTYGENNGRIDW